MPAGGGPVKRSCAAPPKPMNFKATEAAGGRQEITLPQGAFSRVRVWAVDEAGNRGRAVKVRRR